MPDKPSKQYTNTSGTIISVIAAAAGLIVLIVTIIVSFVTGDYSMMTPPIIAALLALIFGVFRFIRNKQNHRSNN